MVLILLLLSTTELGISHSCYHSWALFSDKGGLKSERLRVNIGGPTMADAGYFRVSRNFL
jgi:hypothetical protein